MADNVIKPILDLDLGGSVNSLKELKKHIEACQGAMVAYDRESEEYKKLQGEVVKSQTKMNEILGDTKDTTKAAAGSYNALNAEMKKLQKEAKNVNLSTEEGKKQFAELSTRINDINSNLKKMDAGMGNYQRNVGNYGSAFKGALTNVASAMRAGVAPTKALKVAFTELWASLGPIGAVLAVISFAIKQVTEAFKRNEDATNSLKKAAAPFVAVWNEVQRIFDKVVQIVAKVITKFSETKTGTALLNAALLPLKATLFIIEQGFNALDKALDKVTGAFEKFENRIKESKIGQWAKKMTDTLVNFIEKVANTKLGRMLGLDDMLDDIKEYRRAMNELVEINQKVADTELAIAKAQREYTRNAADRNNQIAKLRQISEDTTKSEKEREAALVKIEQIQLADAQELVSLRQKEYDLIKLRNSTAASGTADLQAEADAYAALIDADTRLQEQKIANMKRQNQINKAATSEARQLAKEEYEAKKEAIESKKELLNIYIKAVAKGTDEELTLQKELLAQEKQLDIIKAQYKIKDTKVLTQTLINIEKQYQTESLLLEQTFRSNKLKDDELYLKNVRDGYKEGSREWFDADVALKQAQVDNLFKYINETENEYQERVLSAEKELALAKEALREKDVRDTEVYLTNLRDAYIEGTEEWLEADVVFKQGQINLLFQKMDETDAEFKARVQAAQKELDLAIQAADNYRLNREVTKRTNVRDEKQVGTYDWLQADIELKRFELENLKQQIGESDEDFYARKLEKQQEFISASQALVSKYLEDMNTYGNSISSIMDSVGSAWESYYQKKVQTGEKDEAWGKKQFENLKNMQYAQTSINTATSMISAMADPTVPSYYVKAANAATALATGIAQMIKIKNTTYSSNGGNNGNNTITAMATPIESDYRPQYTRNVTSASDVDNLAKAMEQRPLWVSVLDINKAQAKVVEREKNSNF